MEKMIALCGITCTDCKALLATRNNDDAAKRAIAEEWNIQPDDVECDGCTNPTGRHINYWTTCEIRKCGTEKAVATCAACPDYACEPLARFHEHAPKAKETLESLRNR